ncbi:hypothetical protein [Singulisphaera sp. PoT]|uniref:hypothetical protein n=1 Tax=Singulisphaera sp. PoT TaxID=3411797 RepID=UPI003BF55836
MKSTTPGGDIARRKRLAAGALTVVLMGILAWSGLRRPAPETAPDVANPADASAPTATNPADDRIRSLLDSARKGDVTSYLASFDGPIRQRLEREVEERGREAFADSLRDASKARKSHAIFSAVPEGAEAARVTVETVYPDRNERQTYRVEQRPEGWLVTDVETIRGHEPKAKYGTPANYQEPEAAPVPSTEGFSVENGEGPASPNP